ncbi:fasciclin domain-containing protein [Polymorphobacter multimanifer]|uniref:fasciclin domain-containing protein n=1 Tax=Polymorphobacter multimanifer TaxID=1070431 RepID=UPI0035711DE3
MHDIVDTAVAAGSFKTLVAAVTAADLVDTLKGTGPFTVFAPSDDAFAKLPAGTVDDLVKPENKAKLAAILTLHVMSGKVMAADVAGNKLTPASVNGETLDVDGTNGVTVNGAHVTTADIACTNGVIHVIDAVLLPKA